MPGLACTRLWVKVFTGEHRVCCYYCQNVQLDLSIVLITICGAKCKYREYDASSVLLPGKRREDCEGGEHMSAVVKNGRKRLHPPYHPLTDP